ncbi:MAG: aspartyl protease family protein [bacterium]
MGEVRQKVILENFVDYYLSKDGRIKEDEIRKVEVTALVDTGSTMLVLPQDIVERLGLKMIESIIVTYADERKEKRDVFGGVMVRIEDRMGNFDCVVGPPLSEPLIGQIVLEELDLVVDCKENRLSPRPESPYLPLLKLK